MKPEFGVLGQLPDQKFRETTGAELAVNRLIGTLESLGTRLVWERATPCPCRSTQTDQPDLTCELCERHGVIYFGPKNYVAPQEAGTFTAVQQAIIDRNGGAVIRGYIQRIDESGQFYDLMGNWTRGAQLVTVRHENIIGFYDRITNLDSEISYPELVTVEDPTAPLSLRYLATGVNHCRSLTTVYEQDEDFTLVDGKIVWIEGREPAADTILTVHYLTHPSWIAVTMPHVIRASTVHRGIPPAQRTATAGNPAPLAVQTAIKFEFLPKSELPPAPSF